MKITVFALVITTFVISAMASPASDARRAARPQMDWYASAHPACEWCGRGPSLAILDRLEVHHIIPCSVNPTLAADTNNMIRLCRRDHIVLGHAGDGACRRYIINIREIIRIREVRP